MAIFFMAVRFRAIKWSRSSITQPRKRPAADLPGIAKEHDDVVADAPARLDDEARALMVVADVVIFPMEPTIKSLRSTKSSKEVLEYAREITGGNPREAWIVINKAKKQTRILKEVQEAAANLGLVVAKTVIGSNINLFRYPSSLRFRHRREFGYSDAS